MNSILKKTNQTFWLIKALLTKESSQTIKQKEILREFEQKGILNIFEI